MPTDGGNSQVGLAFVWLRVDHPFFLPKMSVNIFSEEVMLHRSSMFTFH